MITFEEVGETWHGEGRYGRRWVITRVLTGWRLQFVDPGGAPVNSGVYGTLEQARNGAGP